MRTLGAALIVALVAGITRAEEHVRPDTGVVAGRVIDASGAPIVGADVRLTRLDRELGPLSYSSMRSTLSKADGSFRFEKVAASAWLIDARDEQRYLRNPYRLSITRERERIERLELTLEPASAIEGVVTDEAGQPLAGVGVAIGDGGLQGKEVDPVATVDIVTGEVIKLPPGSSYPRLPLKLALTDEKGHFRLAPVLPEIPASVRVGGLAAFHDKTLTGVYAPPGGAAHLEITLTRGAAITGRVLRPDGRPISDAKISLLLLETQPTQDAWIVLPRARESSAFGVEAARLITGGEGLFRFEGLNTARYLIDVEAEGYCRGSSSILAILRDGEVMPLEVTITDEFKIEGSIDDVDSLGLAEASVEVYSLKESKSGVEAFLPPHRTKISPDGRFTLHLPTAEPVPLRIQCVGVPPLILESIAVNGEPLRILRKRHALVPRAEVSDEEANPETLGMSPPSRW